jgi:hypothetical protein
LAGWVEIVKAGAKLSHSKTAKRGHLKVAATKALRNREVLWGKEWCPKEDSNLHDREATSS